MSRLSWKHTAASTLGATILALGGTAIGAGISNPRAAPSQVTIPGSTSTTSPSVTTTIPTTSTTVAASARPQATTTSTSGAAPAAGSPSTTAPVKRGVAKALPQGSAALAGFRFPQAANPPQLAEAANGDGSGSAPNQKPVAATTGRTRSGRSGPRPVLCLLGALAALGFGAVQYRMLKPAQTPS